MNPWGHRSAWALAREADQRRRSQTRIAAIKPKVLDYLRTCLKCREAFSTDDKYNRLCPRCK